jgi:hypothetical protein
MQSYEPRSSTSHAVIVGLETETMHGWSWSVAIETDSGRRNHHVRMSYHDHDLWSGGARPPSVVLKHVLMLLADRVDAQTLPGTFDVAVARRLVEGFDHLARAEAG